jgi:hypothetical protein
MHRQSKEPVLRITETQGNAVTTFNRQITPIGRVVEVYLPFGRFIWHRPAAVEVREQDTTYRLPIHYSTSRVTSAIVLAGLATVLVPLVIQKTLVRRSRTS